jgi:hypothetical protein
MDDVRSDLMLWTGIEDQRARVVPRALLKSMAKSVSS